MASAMMVALVAISLTPVVERVEFATVVAQLHRLSEPHLKDQPTDTPDIRRDRKRLADLTAYLDRYAARLIQGEIQEDQYYIGLVVIDNATSSGFTFSPSATEQLVWYVWGWIATEKLVVVGTRARRLGPPPLVHPGQLDEFIGSRERMKASVSNCLQNCHFPWYFLP